SADRAACFADEFCKPRHSRGYDRHGDMAGEVTVGGAPSHAVTRPHPALPRPQGRIHPFTPSPCHTPPPCPPPPAGEDSPLHPVTLSPCHPEVPANGMMLRWVNSSRSEPLKTI